MGKTKPKRRAPPPESDPLRRFYVSLFKQKPNSQMAIRWLCENGLGHIVIDFEPLCVSNPPAGGAFGPRFFLSRQRFLPKI